MNDLDRSILTYSEAGRAALAEIERLNAERDTEKARADAAEQMVAELRVVVDPVVTRLNEAGEENYEDGYRTIFKCGGRAEIERMTAALTRTEPVAGRWVPAAERDAARAEVERLRVDFVRLQDAVRREACEDDCGCEGTNAGCRILDDFLSETP